LTADREACIDLAQGHPDEARQESGSMTTVNATALSIEHCRGSSPLPHSACSSCNLRDLCLPIGLPAQDMERLDALVTMRRSLQRGESLFRRGDTFSSIYAVRTGFFKTTVSTGDGRDQVTGFQMAGELLGLDGIGDAAHNCDAVALEDSQVCVIPFNRLEELSQEFGSLQRQFHRVMSREIVRDHDVMLLLSSMTAEERVGAFILNLSHRLEARGFSPSAFVLRMTRAEIGAYLGLKLETVSRSFSKLHDDGVLDVRQREVRIVDPDGLRRLVAGKDT
jgi:CRP/FNR family transcriptional regulator, anaerobic regulatory protein